MTTMIFVRFAATTTAVALALAGCSREAEAPVAAPTQPTATVGGVAYACESGQWVMIQDGQPPQLTYRGQTHALRTMPASSGARFIGSGLEWRTMTEPGLERATLSQLAPDQDVAATVLERCSRPVPAAGILPTPAPTTPENPAPGGVLPTAAPCVTGSLKLSPEGGDAGMGHRVAVIGVQNTGAQACSVAGYPGVALIDAKGRAVTTVRVDQNPGNYFGGGGSDGAPTPVTLAPQAKAYFDVAWTVVPNEGAGQTVCPTVATIRLTAPADVAAARKASVTLAQTFSPCGGRVQVRPLRPTAEDTPPTT